MACVFHYVERRTRSLRDGRPWVEGSAFERSARGAEAGDEPEHRVEPSRKGLGVALDLSEQEAALKRGKQRQRELARIGIRSESAKRVHSEKTGHDAGLPALEGHRKHRPSFGLGLGERGTERPDR